MRAMNDAIMIGIGTALADDPLLTCRLPGMANRSPVRIVLDSALRLALQSRLVTTARETPLWVIGREDAPAARAQALGACGVEVIRSASAAGGHLDIGAVLTLLAARGITRLMVEGGPTLAAALVTADLVDEATLFRSSNPIGPDGISALEGLPLAALTQSSRLVRRESEQVGLDTIESFERP
jgi:diaminohydroxyphosphoribosylaminopyrimidine deaminase / 5-amino-6-(5-phosphoribosylamino)uracil reductase